MKLPLSVRNRLLLLTTAGVMSFLALAMITGWRGSEICRRCGRELAYDEWHLGSDGPTLRRLSRQESETVLSRTLASTLGPQTCSHDWCFASGGNYTVVLFSKSCGIGPGRHLWQALRSSNTAAFLNELAKAGDTNAILRWRDRLLDPKQSRDAVLAVWLGSDLQNEDQSWAMVAEREFQAHP